MSKLSLYETGWTNLVFENKNKEYGAYQLRQESSKTSITALFMGLSLLVALGGVSMLISKFRVTPIIETLPPDIPLDETVVLTNINNHPEEALPPTQRQQEAAATLTDIKQLINPIVTTTDLAVDNIAHNTQNTVATDNASTGTGTATNVIPSGGSGVGNGDATPSIGTSNEPVLAATLDKMPEFPGGIAKFYTYVGNNFSKPELDAERTLRVYVSFVIEKDGTMTDIVVKNDPGYGMGREAIRVLKSLKTKWAPGILDGKAVRTAYNLPITIKTETE
jgi:periplasmic protein TonB